MILCPEAALLPYTIPQTDNRSVGSTKAAATSAVDNLLLVHLMHGSTLAYLFIYCAYPRAYPLSMQYKKQKKNTETYEKL